MSSPTCRASPQRCFQGPAGRDLSQKKIIAKKEEGFPGSQGQNLALTVVYVPHSGRRWSSNPSGKCSYERPTRGTVSGTMRSMCGADAGCLARNYQSLPHSLDSGTPTSRARPAGVQGYLTHKKTHPPRTLP